MATLESKLILSLVDKVTEPARRVQKRVGDLNDRIERNNRQVAAAGGNLARAGAAAVGLGAALSAPARAAGNFEAAMADVRKVVDFPTPEAFQKMRSDLLELSKTVPMSVEGLAAIAASAGQAGIAREDIAAFTESAAKIGTAFDIGASEAGNAMKALMTGLGQDVDGVTLLFDKMNELSNSQAATAADITNVVTRVGSTAQGFGFAAEETAAFASAMLAAGGRAETSATSIRNMGKALTLGESASGRQKDALQSLGLEATEVARRMQDDAVGTTMDVLQRINELPAEMQSAMQFDLFGAEARELSKVRQNLDLVREGLRLTGDDAAAAGSSQREFEVRADTLNAKAQLLQNSFERLNIAIGDTLMKTLKAATERIGRIADSVARWAEENPKLASGLIKAAGGLVAFNLAFAGMKFARLLLVGGVLRTFAGGLRAVNAASNFVRNSAGASLALDAALAKMEGRKPGKIRKIGVALKSVAGATGLGKVATGISAVVGAIGVISAPAWLAIGGAIAAVGAAWKYWDRITAIVSGVASAINDELQPVIDWIGEKLEPLEPIIRPIGQAFTELGEGISSAFAAIRDFFTGDIFKREKLGDKEFASIEARSKETATAIIDSVKGAFNDFIDWIAGIPGRIIDALGTISLGNFIEWPEPPKWLRWLMGEEEAAAPPAPTAADIEQEAGQAGQSPAQYAAQVINTTDAPAPGELRAMRDEAAGLRDEIAAIQKEIRNTQPGRGGDAKIAALKEDMAPLKARLGEVEGKIGDAVQTAGKLKAAMQALANANVSPQVDDTSIRRAQEKAERLRSTLQGINAGATANANSKPVDGARAGGGPIRRRGTYLVGEEGAETITPQRSGFVHTARETVRMQERVARQTERVRERANHLARPSAAAGAPPARLGRAAATISTAALIAAPAPVAAAPPPAVQSVAAIRPAPAPVTAPAAPQSAEKGASRPASAPRSGTVTNNVTVGDIYVQGGANASAEEIGEEFGRQISARLRSQFSDEF